MSGLIKKQRNKALAAFSVLELVVAMSVSGIVLASMVSTFITFASGAKSIGYYASMSRDSRTILELFARDMRAAEDVTVATANSIVVQFPEALYEGGSVTYLYDDTGEADNEGSLFRIERDDDGNEIYHEEILSGLRQFLFSYYNPLGDSLSVSTPSILLSVKSVQIDAEMLRQISRTDATDYIISARFMMRNRPVTE